MDNTKELHSEQEQQSFASHEFGKMIETPNAKALLVNEKYGKYGIYKPEIENIKQLSSQSHEQLQELGVSLEVADRVLPALVSLKFNHIDSNNYICGGGFIRPNVILSAAHCLRDPDTGELYNLRAIVDTQRNTYKAIAVYFNKIHSEDIAFIVTDVNNDAYLDLYNRDIPSPKDSEMIILGTPDFTSRFTRGEEGPSFYQKFLRWRGRDNDQDGKEDHSELLLFNNGINSGDSGSFAISNTGELKGVVSRGINKTFQYGGYLEPQEKIVQQYGDFIQAMTKLGVEIQ